MTTHQHFQYLEEILGHIWMYNPHISQPKYWPCGAGGLTWAAPSAASLQLGGG